MARPDHKFHYHFCYRCQREVKHYLKERGDRRRFSVRNAWSKLFGASQGASVRPANVESKPKLFS